MSRHVLVPIDDSEPARAALEHALEWVPADRVTVGFAVDDLEADYGSAVSGDDEPDFSPRSGRSPASTTGRSKRPLSRGRVADAIPEYVGEADVDAIVMGSEGKAGVSRMLLGSVAESVTRRAAVPVTVVP